MSSYRVFGESGQTERYLAERNGKFLQFLKWSVCCQPLISLLLIACLPPALQAWTKSTNLAASLKLHQRMDGRNGWTTPWNTWAEMRSPLYHIPHTLPLGPWTGRFPFHYLSCRLVLGSKYTVHTIPHAQYVWKKDTSAYYWCKGVIILLLLLDTQSRRW